MIIASTLPVFLPIGIHHLQAWNEALCAGRWGRLAANLSERLRRAVDLEHWAAFNRSFEQLCDWLRTVARGTDGAEPPASILLLGGDVHCSSIARSISEPAARAACTSSSARRSAIPSRRRSGASCEATGSRLSEKLFSRLAKLAGVATPSASWTPIRQATFDNALGELCSTAARRPRSSGGAHARARTPRCSSPTRPSRSPTDVATNRGQRRRPSPSRHSSQPSLWPETAWTQTTAIRRNHPGPFTR